MSAANHQRTADRATRLEITATIVSVVIATFVSTITIVTVLNTDATVAKIKLDTLSNRRYRQHANADKQRRKAWKNFRTQRFHLLSPE